MKRQRFNLAAFAAGAIVLGASLSVNATITLTLQDAGSRAMSGFTAGSTVGATITSGELIGIYQFKSSGTEGPTDPFWSTCLSPAGNLDWGTHSYVSDTFSVGAPGRNPASWAAGTQGDAGIQNAQYLWRLFSPTIIASGNANQGAGLALAMYEALYDSTGYGTTDTSGNGRFYVTQGLSGNVQTAYNTYLGALNGAQSVANVTANTGNGYILRSTENGAGQDLIWNVQPVPEPTTVIAGALLLLPFGISTLWRIRKNRVA